MDKIEKSVEFAMGVAMFDGSHHKQWVIDQMLRILLEKDYDRVIEKYNATQGYRKWDEGVEP